MKTAITRAGLIRAAVFFLILILVPVLGGPGWLLNTLIFTIMYAALSSSWNLLGGYAGYPSLGHVAFFGIGAYATAIIFTDSVYGGYAPFFALPLIGIAVGLLSVPIGWVSMRTRADVFAIVTITLLFITQTLAFNLKSLTGGAQGKSVAPAPFDVSTYDWPFYYVMLILLAIAMAISLYFRRSKIGLSLATVRADEDKAHGVGVRVTAVKLIAFGVSAGRRLGLLRRVHLPAIRRRPAHHDRHGADGVPRRSRHALGPCARVVHPRASTGVLRPGFRSE